MVLIVVPPLLISPEAEYMIASADLVLVVAEAEKQTLGELRRAGEILARLRPAAVGSVLNRVRVFRNRGYYKQMLKDTRWSA
jgi:MinD superfamily P-loop ATPase